MRQGNDETGRGCQGQLLEGGRIIRRARARDVDGDTNVDIFDTVIMAGVYGVKQPNPRYDPYCDIDGDGDIDIFDLVAAAMNYGENW
ncbi:MAG: dockerin type I domain-containing protein [Candidatus Bathyarchaeia archaeon]